MVVRPGRAEPSRCQVVGSIGMHVQQAGVSIKPRPPSFAPSQNLSTADIHNLLAASRGLHDALQDDALWLTLCIARWGTLTDVQRWIVPPLPPATPGTPGRVTLPLPQTFR